MKFPSWFKPSGSADKLPRAEDVFMGKYYVPNFERLDPVFRYKARESIKEALRVGPGHGTVGVCPNEIQLNRIVLDFLPTVSRFLEIDPQSLRNSLHIHCIDSFDIDCRSSLRVPKDSPYTITVSHGLLFFVSIMTALFARTTGAVEEEQIEFISREAFTDIANNALEWFWHPAERGIGLVSAPVERLSALQLKFFIEIVATAYAFLVAHELGHLALEHERQDIEQLKRREGEVRAVRQDTYGELQRLNIKSEDRTKLLEAWLKEVRADFRGVVFVTTPGELDAGVGLDDAQPHLISLIPVKTRMLAIDSLLVMLEMLAWRGIKAGDTREMYTSTHPHPGFRRNMIRLYFGSTLLGVPGGTFTNPLELNSRVANLLQP